MNATSSSAIVQMTLSELLAAVAGKQLSAVEATQACLAAIEAHNGALHAFHELYAARALEQAKAVDAGQRTGALAGVPLALKDNLCTTFGHTTCSSKMLANYQSPFDATVVRKLEQAGAVSLGKTILDEFAMGSSTEHSAFGPTRNPWDTHRVPGGSSGGSATAVAARLAFGALGSDTGGSIRQPAALCGIVGLKPTYGAVSRYGLIAFGSSLDQIGPFARTVEDTARLMQVIAGHDDHDSTSINQPVPDYLTELHETPRKLRIGLGKQYLSDANHPAVAAAIEQAIAVYRDAGAEVIEVDLPHTEYGIPVYYIVATAEASSNLARYDGVHYGHRTAAPEDLLDLYARSRAEGFGDEVKRRIMLGTYALCSGYFDAYYLRALKVRRLIARDFEQAFTQCDAILCPTTTAPAFAFNEKTDDPLSMYLNDVYTVNANLAGIPGLSLPGGFATVDGKQLPVGIQLLGPVFTEQKLLQIARVYERATEHHRQAPVLG